MKKIIIASFLAGLCSCAGILSKSDVFIGQWVMSESSPLYSSPELKGMTIKITKEEIFYTVDFNGTDIFSAMAKTSKEKKLMESYNKFQLSPDQRFLFSVMAPKEWIIMYNEDNGTITTPFGWFKKK